MDHYSAALDALTAAGWTVRERSSALPVASVWPPELIRRYPTIPDSLTQFVSRVEVCFNADETAWFLTASDYAGTSDFAFAWNEWGARRKPDPPLGAVVHGVEEFRAVSQVAASFDEFLAKLAMPVRGREGQGPLAGLV